MRRLQRYHRNTHHDLSDGCVCLEWDHVKFSNNYPCTRTNVLFYESRPEKQGVSAMGSLRGAKSGSSIWRIDLARPLSPLFPRSTLDLVLCTEVMEHVSQPVVVLRNLYLLMRPGGVLVLTALAQVRNKPYYSIAPAREPHPPEIMRIGEAE